MFEQFPPLVHNRPHTTSVKSNMIQNAKPPKAMTFDPTHSHFLLTFWFRFLGCGLIILRIRTSAVLLSLMFPQLLRRNPVHSKYFDFDIRPIWQRVRHLIDCFLVHLHAVDRQPRARVQFLVANVTFEMLRLLMLH